MALSKNATERDEFFYLFGDHVVALQRWSDARRTENQRKDEIQERAAHHIKNISALFSRVRIVSTYENTARRTLEISYKPSHWVYCKSGDNNAGQ